MGGGAAVAGPAFAASPKQKLQMLSCLPTFLEVLIEPSHKSRDCRVLHVEARLKQKRKKSLICQDAVPDRFRHHLPGRPHRWSIPASTWASLAARHDKKTTGGMQMLTDIAATDINAKKALGIPLLTHCQRDGMGQTCLLQWSRKSSGSSQ